MTEIFHMTYELITGFCLFAFVSSVTPGPNNLMLMSSGVNFGFRPTIPHMLGISVGFAILLLAVGMGLFAVFERFPATHLALKILSGVYLIWLATKIATSRGMGQKTNAARPMTILQAAMFQWVNPKGWAMAVTAIAVYAPSQSLATIGLVTAVFVLVNLPSVGIWVILGQKIGKALQNPGHMRLFNYVMAGTLVLSMAPVLMA